jgi:hypothetical protein
MIRPKFKREHVADVETAVAKMFAAIKQERPKGIRYAFSKLADGVTFLGLVELENPNENPLLSIPACREFQENMRKWVAEPLPPAPERLEVTGSYNLFG